MWDVGKLGGEGGLELGREGELGGKDELGGKG
jgi:hypothetical protein